MTRLMRVTRVKTAVAAFAILTAAAALAVLGTSSTSGLRQPQDASAATVSLEQGPLER